ncbi:MAG: Serine phosphatase [Candidatus Peregrinibacteria bacterium GW2011_GWA2_44_7]|nr:MAG: Serine phosphatase [Candidatus Peregrinibacteria bacterium GW2011_GWA2_44_7]
MHSIKTKLILALSILVIFLFSVTAFLLIDEKQKELSNDIYLKARAFSELTTPKIVDLYTSLLAEKSFVIFNREIKDIFNKDEDISALSVQTFAGETLYDSTAERDKAYVGPQRLVQDPDTKARIRANMPSYLLASGRIVYLKKDDLHARVVHTTNRIVLLLVFGVLLGLGFGWVFSGRITTPIEKLKEGALIIGKGDFKARVAVTTKDEVGLLAETFNKMAGDLEVSTKALVYKERVAKELELAAKIQTQILPQKLPGIAGLDIAAAIIPAVEIGGDSYDFISVDPDTNLIYISDVTGHGIPSGIVASITNALIYSYAHAPNMSDILVNVNRVMKEKTVSNMFMTLLMLRYNKGALSYVSAGHPEMLHYSGAEKKVCLEKGGGIALGMVPDIGKLIKESSVQFNVGDCVVIYSDGIPEAGSASGEMYGMQRFKRALNDNGELMSAEAIKNALVTDVKQFMGTSEQLDDITIVVLRRTA